MSTEWERDLQELIDLREGKLILKRTIKLLVAAGHITEEQVEKAREIAISLTRPFVGNGVG